MKLLPHFARVASLATFLKTNCLSPSNDENVLDAMLSYCQDRGNFTAGLHYYPDGTNDFAKYPIETLAEGAGDCEDKSILFASLAEALGYEALICIVPGHAFVAVHMASAPTHYTGSSAWSITVGGLQYWICETTMYGWRVGDCPSSYQSEVPVTAAVA